MKAAVLDLEHKPYKITIRDEPLPIPKGDEVLIRVIASCLCHADKQMINGSMERTLKKLRKRSPVVTGIEASGVVESDGKRFKKGDEVIAAIDYMNGVHTHAEYTVIPEKYLGYKPTAWTHEEAASVSTGLLTAIEALEKQGKIEEGFEVLIHGASGGVGVYAVQLAHHHNCHVTATTNESNIDFVKSLGADSSVDYHSDFLRDRKFNLIFDAAGKLNFTACQGALAPKGVFITTQPLRDLGGGLRAVFSAKKWAFLYVAHSGKNRMARLLQLAQHELVNPVVDSVYDLDNIEEAFDKYLNASVQGRIVIRMSK
jgi:NADPH:quinone reductase-like Zn-dependent oxidoreductase